MKTLPSAPVQAFLGRLYTRVSLTAGWFARTRWPRPLMQPLLRWFVRTYAIDLSLLPRPLESYASLNEFFTRDLRPEARPIDSGVGVVVSPVDGRVHNLGEIEAGIALQAKGIRYSLEALLTDPDEAALYANGSYLTLYLSPSDCHHIFAPVEGELEAAVHVPGVLFPVREPYASQMQGLYTRNERLAAFLQTSAGRVAVVMVGATNVGNIELRSDRGLGVKRREYTRRDYASPPYLERGQKLGTFHLGSTVVMLFSERVRWRADLLGQTVCYGEGLNLV